MLSQLADFLSYDPFYIVTIFCYLIGIPSAVFLLWSLLWWFDVLGRVSDLYDDLNILWKEEGIHRARVAIMFWSSGSSMANASSRTRASVSGRGKVRKLNRPYFDSDHLHEFPHTGRHERYNYAKAVLIALLVLAVTVIVLWAMGEL